MAISSGCLLQPMSMSFIWVKIQLIIPHPSPYLSQRVCKSDNCTSEIEGDEDTGPDARFQWALFDQAHRTEYHQDTVSILVHSSLLSLVVAHRVSTQHCGATAQVGRLGLVWLALKTAVKTML